MSKYFLFHWLDNTTTYGKGKTVAEAASCSASGLRALDYYEELKELPDNMKEMTCISLDGIESTVSKSTLIGEKLWNQIQEGMKEIEFEFARRMFKYTVTKRAFDYLLVQYN